MIINLLTRILNDNPGHLFISGDQDEYSNKLPSFLIHITPQLVVRQYRFPSTKLRGFAFNKDYTRFAICCTHRILEFELGPGTITLRNRYHFQDSNPHDIVYLESGLWVVLGKYNHISNLYTNAKITIKGVTPQPPYRCALNSFAYDDNSIKYVSLFGITNEPNGYRYCRYDKGLILTIPEQETVVSGISCPHSIKLVGNQLYFAASGNGLLCSINLETSVVHVEASFNGFLRGWSIIGNSIIAGISKLRWPNFSDRPTFLPIMLKTTQSQQSSAGIAGIIISERSPVPLDKPFAEYTLQSSLSMHSCFIPLSEIANNPIDESEIYQITYIPVHEMPYEDLDFQKAGFQLLSQHQIRS